MVTAERWLTKVESEGRQSPVETTGQWTEVEWWDLEVLCGANRLTLQGRAGEISAWDGSTKLTGQVSTPSPRTPPVIPLGQTMLPGHAPGRTYGSGSGKILDSDFGTGASVYGGLMFDPCWDGGGGWHNVRGLDGCIVILLHLTDGKQGLTMEQDPIQFWKLPWGPSLDRHVLVSEKTLSL